MHVTLSYIEFQGVGHRYLNCLLRCSCIISPDFGLPTQVRKAEQLYIAKLFNLERADIFFKFSAASIALVKTEV